MRRISFCTSSLLVGTRKPRLSTHLLRSCSRLAAVPRYESTYGCALLRYSTLLLTSQRFLDGCVPRAPPLRLVCILLADPVRLVDAPELAESERAILRRCSSSNSSRDSLILISLSVLPVMLVPPALLE